MRQVVEENVAHAATEDDAERHPQNEIVEVGYRQRRFPAPQFAGADKDPRVPPAEQDAGDVGERVPADRERADVYQDGVERRVWNNEQRHPMSDSRSEAPLMW